MNSEFLIMNWTKYLGGFSLGVPPLPIPNREVKPERADGTAPQCGRVGRRLFNEAFSRNAGGFFLQPGPPPPKGGGLRTEAKLSVKS